MATELKKYVCTTATGSGDGSSAANAYTTLEACMNANEQNLVTADKYFNVEITGDCSTADTTAVTIHNYTTDATRYINIYTTGTARHAGVYSESKYRIAVNNAWGIDVYTTNVSIDGLIIKIQQSNYTAHATIRTAFGPGYDTTKITIKNCILLKLVNNGEPDDVPRGLHLGGWDHHMFYIYNNIIYGFTSSGSTDGFGIFMIVGAGDGTVIYNNTIYGCDTGILATGIIKNNIVNNTKVDYSISGTASNNIDEDGSGDITATLTFTNLTEGSEDFHLVAEDTAAIDAGVDLGSPYDYDIDGEFRDTYTPWDIGADEYVSAEVKTNVNATIVLFTAVVYSATVTVSSGAAAVNANVSASTVYLSAILNSPTVLVNKSNSVSPNLAIATFVIYSPTIKINKSNIVSVSTAIAQFVVSSPTISSGGSTVVNTTTTFIKAQIYTPVVSVNSSRIISTQTAYATLLVNNAIVTISYGAAVTVTVTTVLNSRIEKYINLESAI